MRDGENCPEGASADEKIGKGRGENRQENMWLVLPQQFFFFFSLTVEPNTVFA